MIFCIGECALDIVFQNSTPIGTVPGGRILNAARILSTKSIPVAMISEVSADRVGDIIVGFLTEAGVDVKSVDRFTEGVSPTNLYFSNPEGEDDTVIRYQNYPDLRFDVIWPKISSDDIVIFGGFYAIDPDMRGKLTQLLKYADEIGATTIYLPGFMAQQAPRITRVMPAILENLETASLIIARNDDLNVIFGINEPKQCYHDHINFYCRSLINIDTSCGSIDYYSGKEVTSANIPMPAARSLMWNAGAVAGVAKALHENKIGRKDLDMPDDNTRRTILATAVAQANESYAELLTAWQKNH